MSGLCTLESRGSRSGRASIDSTTEISYEWRISGSDDITVLMAELTAERPASVVDPVWGYTLLPASVEWNRVGHKIHDFTVVYADETAIEARRQLDVGERRFSFSTTGGTIRIFTSLETMGRWNKDGPMTIPANRKYGQPIQEDDEGVEGTDIVVPAMQLNLEYRHPRAFINGAYVNTVHDLTGRYNNAVFFGRQIGEALFLGGEGSQGTVSDPTLRYSFAIVPNVSDQVIGEISGISKRGHDFLWVVYEGDVDGQEQRRFRKPIQVHVERLYQPGDLSQLGVGVDW